MGPIVSRLKAIREAAGLRQEDMAGVIGLKGKSAHGQVSRVERGLKVTPIDKVERWIEAAGHDVYIVSRKAPAFDDARAMLGALSDDRRELALRVIRLLERLGAEQVDRLRNDVEYLETRTGLRNG